MKPQRIGPASFFRNRQPEPLVIVQSERGPQMLTLSEYQNRMSPQKDNKKKGFQIILDLLKSLVGLD